MKRFDEDTHTGGDWVLTEVEEGYAICAEVNQAFVEVALVHRESVGCIDEGPYYTIQGEEARKNAELILNAPDLLQMVKDLSAALELMMHEHDESRIKNGSLLRSAMELTGDDE